MEELIDEFQPRFPRGRNKALTLLVLTSIGSAIKFIFFLFLLVDRLQRHYPFSHMSARRKFVYFVVFIVAFTGIVNVLASLMMYRRKLRGFSIYVINQLVAAFFFTWGIFASARKLYEEQQIALLLMTINLIIFTILYRSNRKYYSVVNLDGEPNSRTERK